MCSLRTFPTRVCVCGGGGFFTKTRSNPFRAFSSFNLVMRFQPCWCSSVFFSVICNGCVVFHLMGKCCNLRNRVSRWTFPCSGNAPGVCCSFFYLPLEGSRTLCQHNPPRSSTVSRLLHLSSLLGAAAELISVTVVLSSVPVPPSKNRQGPLPITCSQSCSKRVPLIELGRKDSTPALPTEEGKEQETEPPTRKVTAER